jgi:hypothetical protein
MYVLMLSVFKIRKFYQDNKLTEEMNTKAMVLHVVAFGSYVISVFVISTSISLLIIQPNNQKFIRAFEICAIITTATATLS